jgi:hypothetical protein
MARNATAMVSTERDRYILTDRLQRNGGKIFEQVQVTAIGVIWLESRTSFGFYYQ